MRKWLPLLLLFLPLASFGQSILHIPWQQCVWHSGDNPTWAAPNLNEAGWQPIDVTTLGTNGAVRPPHVWIRCHADLSPLRAMAHPALQVADLYSAYQVFLNGKKIGGAGNLHTGAFSMDTIRQYPVPVSTMGNGSDTVALRMTQKNFAVVTPPAAPELFAGESDALRGRRARQIVAQSRIRVIPALGFFAVAIAGLMLLGLFYYDRSRRELLYLSIACGCVAASLAINFCRAVYLDYPLYPAVAVVTLANMAGPLADILFFFRLARRRVPWIFWIAVAVPSAVLAQNLITLVLSPDTAFHINLFHLPGLADVLRASLMVYALAPFAAFWPWRQITGRMRPLAALCTVWGAVQILWFTAELLPYRRLGLPNYFNAWQGGLLEIRAAVIASVLLTLMALLFRDQRQVTQERAVLAGEMQAAGQIQQMLVPASVQTAPNIQLQVAFQPMREVGGDFYQCNILSDGTQRILLGDVSGKGAAAAMSATLLIGAAALCNSHPPQTLLSQLNQVLFDKQLGGFATCLCADISANGTLTVANAGHLSPYRNGDEIELDSGLPLGITESAEYAEKSLQLQPADQLTFLSDGVIEARNATGELYGFDRTRSISTQTAQQIANAAQSFGQEDDITVLTLTLAQPEVTPA